MKQLLILSTIVLLFVFTSQRLPKLRFNHSHVLNKSSLFNSTKCPTGYKRVNHICVKSPIRDLRTHRFLPKNETTCPFNKKRVCFKSRYSNKTYCVCRNFTSTGPNKNITTPNTTPLTCRPGTTRRCRYNYALKLQHCYCQPNPTYYRRNNTISCPSGQYQYCYYRNGVRNCYCRFRNILPTHKPIPAIA